MMYENYEKYGGYCFLKGYGQQEVEAETAYQGKLYEDPHRTHRFVRLDLVVQIYESTGSH
jgi:hypothetical protein